MSIFSEGEIQRRHTALQLELHQSGIDICLLTSADNVYYSTGLPLLSEWGRPMWVTLPQSGNAAIFGAEIERENMQKNAHHSDVHVYGDSRTVHEQILSLATAEIKSRTKTSTPVIGIEEGALTVAVFAALQAAFPGARFVDVGALIGRSRIIKSTEEISLLRVAAQAAKIGADAFIEALTPGMTELAVAGHAHREIERAIGALYPEGASSSYVYAQFGKHTLTPHLHPTGRRLKRGDLVALNVFPVVWGYCIELERTFVAGESTDRQQELLGVLDEAFSLGKQLSLSGSRMSDVHDACSAVLSSAGLQDAIRHGTGHAHGIMIGSASREEAGEIREYNTARFQPGMLNSIEPGFYLPQEGGFRHSDVMLFGEEQAECITEFPTAFHL